MSLLPMISGQFLAVSERFIEIIENVLVSGIPVKEASYGEKDQDSDHDFNIVYGLAIINIKGSLSKNVSWWSQYFGYATSYSWIKEQVQTALDLPEVKSILLSLDSPGGSVDGVKELSDFLHRESKTKPFYTYADGCMCSAAYWIGSVGKEIAGPATADIGSIGVRTLHIDKSEMNKKYGAKITHLAAGEYKAVGNSDEPLTGTGKDYIMSQLNQVYDIFCNDVARNRNIKKEETLKMADGKVFIGQEALSVGLIDIVTESKDTFIEYIVKKENLKDMDINEFKANHEDLFNQVVADTKADLKTKTKTLVKDSVAAETARILEISTAVIGKDLSGKLSSVVNSGADAKQVNAMKEILGITEDKTSDADTDTKQAILDNLKSVHAEGVNQKKSDQDITDINAQVDNLVNLVQ